MIEDNEIIQAVLRGDREAYSILVRRHHARVLGFCVSMLSSRPEGEDAAQGVFVRVFKALPSFRRDSAFSTWLYRIAHNHCLTLLQVSRRRPVESWDSFTESRKDDAENALGIDAPDPLESSDIVRRALDFLPEEHRAALALRLQGLGYQEIADALEITTDAVKARLKRARASLREKYGHFLLHRDV